MTRYRCEVCRVYPYDTDKGDPLMQILPGTLPADFPETWRCPFCGSRRQHLKILKGWRILIVRPG
ncbi:MAG: rubredoxin [Methanoregulaceae archaeon]|nr:rubredoxin [Methanoregulaceae archaeon]